MGAKEWFVWDGDQVLYEVRESDTPWVGPGQYGRVGYTHAFGIDRPLELIKDGSLVVVPHANYRGQFDSGTEPSGAQYSCAGGYFSGCTEVAWAGADLRAFLQRDGGPPSEWLGSLAAGHRDQSGNIYMRNR